MRLLSFLLVAFLSVTGRSEDTTTLEEKVSVPVSVSGSMHFLFSNQKDEFDATLPATNILRHEGQVRAEVGPFLGEMTFNNKFHIRPVEETANDDFFVEKKTVTGNFGAVQVVVGDSYQELGRGVALSLNRNLPFGLDNTLEGISVKYRPKAADLQAFGGRVNVWDVPLALNPVENPLSDREMLLAGGSGTLDVTPATKFGVHGFYALTRDLEKTRYDRSFRTLGMSLSQEGIGGAVDFYGESNRLYSTRTAKSGEFDLPIGYGTYGSLSWSPGPIKAKVEVKDYRDYHFDFRRAPTLEEDVVETTNTDEVTAVRSQVEVLFPEAKTSLLGSFLAGEDRLAMSRIHHAVFGTKFTLLNVTSWEARAGYRWLPNKAQLMHASLKTKIKTFAGQSLELGARKQITDTDLDIFPTRDDRNYFDVTYNLNERFSIGGGFELIPTNLEEAGTHFFNGSITYRSGNLNGRAFVGRTSGGPQCSGGVCRIIPPFSGAMVDMAVSF